MDNNTVMCYNRELMTKTLPENVLADGMYNPDKRNYKASDFNGYCASPLLLIGEHNKDHIDAQNELSWRLVDAAFGETFTQTGNTSLASFVASSVLNRMLLRQGMNSVVYNNRKFIVPRAELVPDAKPREVYEACKAAKLGYGSPIQNNMARIAFGMSSIEIANLTTLGDFRGEHVFPMWDDVCELADIHIPPSGDDIYNLQLLGFDRDIRKNQHLGATRVYFKRHVATLPDGAELKARTTTIINMKPSVLTDQSIVKKLKEQETLEQMAKLPAFQELVRRLIDDELNGCRQDGAVLAQNDTIYAVSRTPW